MVFAWYLEWGGNGGNGGAHKNQTEILEIRRCTTALIELQGGASTGYSLTAFVLIALVENSDSKVKSNINILYISFLIREIIFPEIYFSGLQ